VPRVIGIDPGTVSIDLCGLDHGRLFMDRSFPTADALADPAAFVTLLAGDGPLDLIVGPSGYGLPLKTARDLTETDYRLAYLAAAGETGGIGGLRTLVRALAAASLPVMLTPGVIHLDSVPVHRKVNRVDMGTADKVCAAALAVREHAARHRRSEHETSFVLLELGGAFTAALAVRNGRIVDGIAGSAGPIGARAAGALDGEVAFLAGSITKRMVFEGGAASIAGTPAGDLVEMFDSNGPRGGVARQAYVESATKAVIAASLSLADERTVSFDVILSGRLGTVDAIAQELTRRLTPYLGAGTVHRLAGFAAIAKHAAQGAALLADGLAGGSAAPLVEAMAIREARGTVLDHLYVMSAATARARLGLEP
jgi:predicted butyrate kinase (DUF1464 family)